MFFYDRNLSQNEIGEKNLFWVEDFIAFTTLSNNQPHLFINETNLSLIKNIY